MSDDEYYGGSPYDDFEDMLWDADPAPDLADDLAQHAAYSPVWQDDPTGELEAYHSDWEYYSDDYYDDDPSILRNNPVDGTAVQGKHVNKTYAYKRGKKRKYEEPRQSLDAGEHNFLAKTIQGTVWASGGPPQTKVFREGQQETVGLLEDWRERFKLDNGQSRTFGQGQLKRDESWANDLSLEDMGLTHVRERAGTRNGMDDKAGDAELDEEEEEGQEEEDTDFDATQDLESVETPPSENQRLSTFSDVPPRQNGHQQHRTRSTRHNGDQSSHKEMSETEHDDAPARNKRQKISMKTTSPRGHVRGHPTAKKAETRLASDLEEVDGSAPIEHSTAKSEKCVADSDERSVLHVRKSPPRVHSRSMKRRLSSEQDDSHDVSTATTARRSKRVASERLLTNQDSHDKNKTHVPVTRTTKLRKR